MRVLGCILVGYGGRSLGVHGFGMQVQGLWIQGFKVLGTLHPRMQWFRGWDQGCRRWHHLHAQRM